VRPKYQSDITREQYEIIRHSLEKLRKTTCPRKYDLYDIFCAILYIVKEGCTWRGLPHDFPNWRIVYRYYQIWGEVNETGKSVFERAMQELVESERVTKGRKANTSMIIVDSKSIKNTNTAEEKGYDAGKKLQG
jgi:transposase